jgi:hypothetical protein
MPPLNDVLYSSLAASNPVAGGAGGATVQVRSKEAVLHRIIVGTPPGANRTITLRDGLLDTSDIKMTVLISTTPPPVIDIGVAFRAGIRAIFSGACDVTFVPSD